MEKSKNYIFCRKIEGGRIIICIPIVVLQIIGRSLRLNKETRNAVLKIG